MRVDVASIPSYEELEREMCKRSLRYYMERAWSLVNAEPFQDNWHIGAICEHLQALSAGQITKLIVNIPPGNAKSSTSSVMWPTWEWGPGGLPGSRFICASYAANNSNRDALFARNIIESNWYQSRWPVRLSSDQNEKRRYHNTVGGFRFSSTVEGSILGEGGNRIIIDDPHNTQGIESKTERERVISWFCQTMQSRIRNPKDARWVIIMQRIRHDDLVGWIKEHAEKEWEWLVLPAEFEPGRRCRTKIFFDPRTEPGEPLFPARWNSIELAKLAKTMGRHAYDAQYQQRPTPLEGSLLKRHWWKFYECAPAEQAQQCDYIFQSWDCAFKKLEDSDYVVGQVWGVKGANRYLLDQVRERLSFTETCAAIASMSAKWPEAKRKLIEDKANGSAVIDYLKNNIIGLVPVNPTESKTARAIAVSPEIEAGNVWLPSAAGRPWVEDFIEECAAFDKGAYDDMVDAMTQALQHAAKHHANIILPFGVQTKINTWSSMS